MKHAMILLSLLLYAAFARKALAQQAPAKTANQPERSAKLGGAITGRVIGPDGQPITDAEVSAIRITDGPRTRRSAVSDEEGNFTLAGLSPGAYTLLANAPGYVSADLPIENAIHRIGENIIINMVKGGVITGRVTDEAGEPLVGMTVSQQRLRNNEGKTTTLRAEMSSYGSWKTDDRGIYRIYGLRPGTYIVSIGGLSRLNSPDDVQTWRDAPTFYPSATRESAAEVHLRGGEEVPGIDIRHRGERGRIVSGSVSGETELSYQSLSVTLRGGAAGGFDAYSFVSSSRGFAFYGVPDGEYELSAAGDREGGETTASASRRISVKGANVSGIELKLVPRGSIAGRVVIESSNPPEGCAVDNGVAENQPSDRIEEQSVRRSVVEEIVLRAVLDEPDRRAPSPRFSSYDIYGRAPNAKGEFALKNLDAGRYRITANLPDDGWHIRAIKQTGVVTAKPPTGGATVATGMSKNPVDIMRNGMAITPGDRLSGVEVIIAQGAATLNGRVVPAKGRLPARLRAHLIPAELAIADDVIHYAQVDLRDDGSFTFKHIAPGKYLIHLRQLTEKEASDDQIRPVAWDKVERTKLRREATTAKNEIELRPCERVKDYVLRYTP
jgi:Carboxypeptidase regulatory-like domain